MRIFSWIFSLALAVSVSGAEIHFNFGDYPEGATPTNFQAVLRGGGQPAVWKILSAETPSAFAPFGSNAPSLNRSRVLAQTSQDPTDEHYPLLVFTGGTFRNFKFTTQFQIVSGVTEQMAGVVFRYQNPSNFYVFRASALGKNICFYKLINGEIKSPIKVESEIPIGVWHELAIDCAGNSIEVTLDGKKALPTITDDSPPDGQLGFWTKSDAVVYYTDAAVVYTPIIAAAQTIINELVEKQPRILGLRIYTADTTNTTRVVASKDTAEIGKPGTDAEHKAIAEGAVSFGRESGAVVMTLPLHDRNGDFIAAVRVRLKSFLGETQDNALARARMIVGQIQSQVMSDKDLL